MSAATENSISLPSFNFKESHLNLSSNTTSKSINISDYEGKYDPLIFCRTCANMDSCLVPIFKKEGLEYNLNKKIEKYLPIHVSQEDDLPVHLCYHCASTLIAWDTLVVGCVEAEKKLNILKNSLNQKKIDEVQEIKEKNERLSVDSDDEPLINIKSTVHSKKINPQSETVHEKDVLFPSKKNSKIERPELKTKFRKISIQNRDENTSNRDKILTHKRYSECGKKVLNSMKKHLKIHHRNKKDGKELSQNLQKCPLCRKTYNDFNIFSDDLYSHLTKEIKENSGKWNPNKCKVCGQIYEIPNQLLGHLLVHLKEKKNSEKKLRKGKREAPEEECCKPKCEICGKTISRKYSMKRHLATHTGEKKFTCHHCGKQYAQESGLQRHMLVIHEGVRKYKCPICSLIFGSNIELKSHQDKHTDPRPFQCDQCGRTFISQKHLYHHRKYHHTANGMRQMCKLCNKYFSSPSVLKRHHKVVHLGLKEFQCHVCSAQLSTKHYLQEHLRLHSDERPEVCSFCGKTFQMTGNLRQHMKTHMGKTQICYVCGKGFTRRCHLLIHMGSHRGLEQLQCEQCNQSFLLKSDLEKHMQKEHESKKNGLDEKSLKSL